MLKIFLIMLLATAASAQQSPKEYVVGHAYIVPGVFCLTQKDASDLAKAYLERGEARYLPESDKAKYKAEAGVVFFIVIQQVAVLNKDKKSIYVVEVLSDRILYLITTRKILTTPPSPGEGYPDDGRPHGWLTSNQLPPASLRISTRSILKRKQPERSSP